MVLGHIQAAANQGDSVRFLIPNTQLSLLVKEYGLSISKQKQSFIRQ